MILATNVVFLYNVFINYTLIYTYNNKSKVRQTHQHLLYVIGYILVGSSSGLPVESNH